MALCLCAFFFIALQRETAGGEPFTRAIDHPPQALPWRVFFGYPACIYNLYPACISRRILGIPLYSCIDLYPAILQQIHCIPLYSAVSVRI